jgi:hypothetical protein
MAAAGLSAFNYVEKLKGRPGSVLIGKLLGIPSFTTKSK